MDLVGTAANEVALVHPGSILKTSSGKVRRAASRTLFESGGTRRKSRAAWRQMVSIAASGVLPELGRLKHEAANAAYAAYCLVLFGISAPLVWLSVLGLPTLDGAGW